MLQKRVRASYGFPGLPAVISALIYPDGETVSRSGSGRGAISYSTIGTGMPYEASVCWGETFMYMASEAKSFSRRTGDSIQEGHLGDLACSIPAREGVPLNPMDYLL